MPIEVSVESCGEYLEDENGVPLDATHIMPCNGGYWKAGLNGKACTTGFNKWLQTDWTNKELITCTHLFKEIKR